ncbi:Hypothetical predicted protein [Olea europaea subsp. europaea]|uniref:Uncharacterized protein n=1 Tax=Olea europaea subsp. europaea TaxID=158383 RepID=A0A8S0RIS9_OLEEU|nr:Hypothetical predicted protein [Olea europaea subsp. europaea]
MDYDMIDEDNLACRLLAKTVSMASRCCWGQENIRLVRWKPIRLHLKIRLLLNWILLMRVRGKVIKRVCCTFCSFHCILHFLSCGFLVILPLFKYSFHLVFEGYLIQNDTFGISSLQQHCLSRVLELQ